MAVEKRLMHYASFDTQSSEESTSAPSTEKQLVLARELKAECEKIGFDSVELTDTGIVYAYLNANTDKKMDRIGFIAHMDTASEITGANVKCRVISKYDGNAIQLNEEYSMSKEEFPALANCIGDDLIVTDGTTLLGADDKAGIEAALQLKEKCPGSTVIVVSMGPPQADVALREALAMGCDDALLISDRAFGGADTWATSSTIAAALKKLDYDVIITGRQAIDGDTAQVGPQIAEHLGIPQVSYVEKMDVEGEDTLVVQRQFEDRHQIIEVKTPCLLTALAELADPRYMSVHGVFDAYREKEVKVWGLEDIKDTVNEGNIGLKGSPTRVKKSFTKQAKGAGTILNDLSDDEAVAAIVEKLQEKHII